MKPPLLFRSRRRAPGFTLIELLTVITIIGILAAILIPTVGKVRESASKAATISNFRQVGTGLLTFAADNRDQLPGVYKIRPQNGAPNTQFALAGGQTAYAKTDSNGPKYLCYPDQIGRYIGTVEVTVGGEQRYYSSMMESPALRSKYREQVVKCAHLGRQVIGDDGQTYYPFGWDSPAQLSMKFSQLNRYFPPAKRWLLHDEEPNGVQWVNNAVHGNTLVAVYFDGHVGVAKNTRDSWDENNDGLLPES